MMCSVAGVATVVTCRTLSKESCPAANASSILGSEFKAWPTRSSSPLVCSLKPALTVSQCENDRIPPSHQPPISSNFAQALATFAIAAWAYAELSQISRSRAFARSWFSRLTPPNSTIKLYQTNVRDRPLTSEICNQSCEAISVAYPRPPGPPPNTFFPVSSRPGACRKELRQRPPCRQLARGGTQRLEVALTERQQVARRCVQGLDQLAAHSLSLRRQNHSFDPPIALARDPPGQALALQAIDEPCRVGWIAFPLVREGTHGPAGAWVEAGEGAALRGRDAEAVQDGHPLCGGGDDVVENTPPGNGRSGLFGTGSHGHDPHASGYGSSCCIVEAIQLMPLFGVGAGEVTS